MKGKRIAIITAAALTLPVGIVTGAQLDKLNFSEAVKQIEENDPNKIINAQKPEISEDTQPYQAEVSDDVEMDQIQDVQEDYQDMQNEFQAEISAYETMYNVWIAQQSLDISEANLEKAQEELSTIQAQYQSGTVSEMDVIQSEINLQDAEVSLEEAKQSYKTALYSANQKLDKPIDEEWTFEEAPTTKVVPNSFFDITMYQDDLEEHPALDTPLKSIEVYTEAIDEADSLNTIITDPTKIRDAQNDRHGAERELGDYYEHELEVSELQLEQQKDAIELTLHQKLDQLNTLSKKIEVAKSNIRKSEEMYEKTQALIENGMGNQQQLTQSRLNIMNQNMQLHQAMKDYALAKKEFELFLDGYMPR